MNCYFCQQPCQPSTGSGETCPQHVSVYHYQYFGRERVDGPADFLFFNCQYKDKAYTVWMYFISLGIREDPLCKIALQNDQVITFPFIPNLTPDNIADKLPTILTFL